MEQNQNKPKFDKFYVWKKILKECDNREWAISDLAEHSYIPESILLTWLKEDRELSPFYIEKICNGMNISLSDFFSTETHRPSFEDDSELSPTGEKRDHVVRLTDEQYEILSIWDGLTPFRRKFVKGLLIPYSESVEIINEDVKYAEDILNRPMKF